MSRPLRADAQRNRAALLQAAAEVFAARGPSASTEDIARAAGVGIGTLFRHFPTKEALLAAVYQTRLARLTERAGELRDAVDPGTTFLDFFRDVVAQSGEKLAITDALAEAGIDPHTAAAGAGAEFNAALRVLLERAQRQGSVRPDLRLADVVALLMGTSRAAAAAGTAASRDRIIAVVVDGLRAHGPITGGTGDAGTLGP